MMESETMDIRPTGPDQEQGVRRHLRTDLPTTPKSKIRADGSAHAPRSRAPELTQYSKRSASFEEVREELVAQAKARLAKGDYMTRSTAEKTAEAILLSS